MKPFGNPVIEMLGRRLRLGVVGGGTASFIGNVHRAAAALDGRFEVAAAVLSSDADSARALGPEVRVNAIAPGMVESNWECRFDRPESFVRSIPLQRPGRPEDYAEVILFLCAGAAYVTGQTWNVDGGFSVA